MPRGFLLSWTTPWQKTGRRRHRAGQERAGLFVTRPVVVLQFEETAFEWGSNAPPPPNSDADWKPERARRVTRWRDADPNEILPIEGDEQ
jgi:hypothetical protein